MKGVKLRTFVIFALAALSGAALLHISQRVQLAEERLAQIQSEIERDEEAIRILNAEWEYLNRPERLEKLAQEFLDLAPPSPDSMMDTSAPIHHNTPPELEAQPVSLERPQDQRPVIELPKPPVKPLPTSASKPDNDKSLDTLLNELAPANGSQNGGAP